MLKRIKWPGWIALILFITVIIIGINQLNKKESEAIAKEKEDKNTTITKVENNALSKYPGLNLRTITKDTDKYTTSISIPIAKSDEINEPIQKWIKDQQENFLMLVKENESILGGDYRAHLNIQLDTDKVSNTIYSLIFTTYQYTGGANGQNIIKTFTVDVKNNKILQLKDIMDMNDEVADEIRMLVKKEIKKDEQIYFYVSEELLDEVLKDQKNWKWSISNDALSIYYDEYEIAAGAAGEINIRIPIKFIQPYLKEEILKELKLSKPKQKETEEIKQEKIVLDPNGKYVALTFDDGPNPKVTPRVLDILKQFDAKATFFMLGSQVEYYPSVAAQVAAEGHEIGNHTNSHADLTKLGAEAIKQEISQSSKRIEQAVGIQPKLLRPPYGAYDDGIIQIAKNYGNSIILWSVDSLDWKNRNVSSINKEVLRDVTNGAIVLMHDIHATTADALPELLTALKKEGYQFITVSQLLDIQKRNGVGPHYGKRP